MPYSAYTLDSLATEILEALGDAGAVFWVRDEVYRAIQEALLVWGAHTSYWRARGQFSTAALTPFYDLSVELPTLRTRAYTLGQLTTEIQYHLLEPPSGASGANATSQLLISQITAALVRNRNELALDVRFPLTQAPFVPGAGGIVMLSQDVAAIVRASWLDALSGVYFPLRREDPFSAQSYLPLWTTQPKTPFGFSVAEAPPITVQLIPAPASVGEFNATYIASAALTVADGTSLAFPDEFAWTIKYGALYDVLTTSAQAMDALRAKYALERYTQAISIAETMRSLVSVRINGNPVPVDTIQALDAARPRWQNQPGVPNTAWTAYDLLAFSKIPNATFSITCDVVRTAPLPLLPADTLQVGREEIPYIFDYARHVLSFKLGGAEFLATMPLMDNFIAGAKQRNSLIRDAVRYFSPLFSEAEKMQRVEAAA